MHISSLISFMNFFDMRFLNHTISDGSNTCSFVYFFRPIKYCRYGFSMMFCTVSSSEHCKYSFISKEPSAILIYFAGLPFFRNIWLYFSSAISQGTIFARFIHLLLGSSLKLSSNVMSNKCICSSSIRYMFSSPDARFLTCFFHFLCAYYITLCFFLAIFYGFWVFQCLLDNLMTLGL